METTIRRHVRNCDCCQKGKARRISYGKLPAKDPEIIPWRSVQVDLIGPYTIRGKDGSRMAFMCLTMIDPATSWFEIAELPESEVTFVRNGEEIIDVVIDKSSMTIARLFNKHWLSRYPRAKYIIFDNGGEFKLNFTALCKSFGLKHKPTTVKNPQANSILERIYAVLGNMMRTSGLDMDVTVTADSIDQFIVDAAWAIRSTYHTVLEASPGAAIFGRDMLFDIPYLADWNAVGRRRKRLVQINNDRENASRVHFDYAVGQKCLLKNDGKSRKAADKYLGPYIITQVHTNGTVRIQRGTISERLNIRRITPYFGTNDVSE